jgi:hypothetical protein
MARSFPWLFTTEFSLVDDGLVNAAYRGYQVVAGEEIACRGAIGT